jgi:hypothetical protein
MRVVGVGDLDGDGDSDVLLRDGDQVWHLLYDPAAAHPLHRKLQLPAGTNVLGVGDFDGDGDDDALLRDTSSVRVLVNELGAPGALTLRPLTVPTTISSTATVVGIADVGTPSRTVPNRADAYSDVILRSGVDVSALLMNGTTVPEPQHLVNASTEWTVRN